LRNPNSQFANELIAAPATAHYNIVIEGSPMAKRLKTFPKAQKVKRGEKFERIVAAIHRAQHTADEVIWNHHINGRQFDVVVKFKYGLYEYLLIIECRDHKRSVQASDVEAFVTKKNGINANKAVMISSSTFQKGAREVAKKYAIDLYTLQYINQMPEELLSQVVVSVVVLYPIGFRKPPSDNVIILVPPDPTRDFVLFSHDRDTLIRQMKESQLSTYGTITIEELLRITSQLIYPEDVPGIPTTTLPRATEQPRYYELQLSIGTMLRFPDSLEPIAVTHLFLCLLAT
jgi:hypothetical protein